MPESVHLCSYPSSDESKRNNDIENEMATVQKAVEMGRSLRAKVGINLRKPLQAVFVITKNEEEVRFLLKMESILAEVLNLKEVIFEGQEDKLVTLSCKANFRVLGRKRGNI